MSSMVKHLISASMLILPATAMAAAQQQPEIQWQRGTGEPAQPSTTGAPPIAPAMVQYDPSEGKIPAALQQWKMLSASTGYSFSEYASFLMNYPDWPNAEEMRKNAEQSINPLTYSPQPGRRLF